MGASNKYHYLSQLLCVFATAQLAGCLSPQLKPGAASVAIFFQDGDSRQCRMLSKIETGNKRIQSFQDAQIVLRNAAYDMGANAIRIQEFKPGKIAQGEALSCPDSVVKKNSYDPYQDENRQTITNNTQTTNTSNNGDTNRQNSDNERNNPGVQTDEVKTGAKLWQRCSYGQYLANGTCQGRSQAIDWRAAVKYCNNIDSADKSWRLPGQKELQAILTKSGTAGAKVDQRKFPNTAAGLYWTADYYDENTTNVVWTVDFQSANSFAYGLRNKAYVRCIAD